jgi:probable rRNA maturation factor
MIVDTSTEDEAWAALPDRNRLARAAVAAVFEVLNRPAASSEISILFADNERVSGLNRDWRGKDGPTNVLSFPAPAQAAPADGPRPLGDIVLASGVVMEEARLQRKPLASHLSHLIVHGVLHLLGYGHEEEDEAQSMRALETAAQLRLGFSDPYGQTANGAEASAARPSTDR